MLTEFDAVDTMYPETDNTHVIRIWIIFQLVWDFVLLGFYWDFMQFSTVFQLYHNDRTLIQNPVQGQEIFLLYHEPSPGSDMGCQSRVLTSNPSPANILSKV